MPCADQNATHYDGCECREAARDREIVALIERCEQLQGERDDAQLMLRATGADAWIYVLLSEAPGEPPVTCTWRRWATGTEYDVPLTQPRLPEINDEVREAMRASLGVE